MVWDKNLLVMSNLYFFYESKEIQVDFITAFYSIAVPNFIDVFSIKVVTAQYEEYLVEELGLYIYAFFPHLLLFIYTTSVF